MANIWLDKHERNENQGQLFTSNTKQFLSARKHSSKKQVFGELKNVIHNQGDATPFKGNVKKSLLLMSASKPSLCVDVLRKQQMKQNFSNAQKQLEKKLKPVEKPESQVGIKFAIAEDAPWDDLEIPVNTCNGQCEKTLEEIWSEMNMIDNAFLRKVIDGGDPDTDDEEDDKDYPHEVADTTDYANLAAELDDLCTPVFTSEVDDLFKIDMFKHELELQKLDLSF